MKIIVKRLIKKGKVEEAIKLYEEMVAQTRKEKGCIVYELCQSEKNISLLVVMEEWRDDVAVSEHRNAPHFTRIVPLISDLTERFEVEEYKKLI